MSFKKYIILIAIGTLAAFSGFLFTINKVDPTQATVFGFIAFYFSLFFTFTGVLSLLMIGIRWIFVKNLAMFANITRSFRQAILFSIVIVSFLLLKSVDLLKWWNAIFIIGVIIGIELFASSRKIK